MIDYDNLLLGVVSIIIGFMTPLLSIDAYGWNSGTYMVTVFFSMWVWGGAACMLQAFTGKKVLENEA